MILFSIFISFSDFTDRVNGESTKTTEIARSTTSEVDNEDEDNKVGLSRKNRERSASRSRSRSPLPGLMTSRNDDLNKYPRKIRHHSTSKSPNSRNEKMNEYIPNKNDVDCRNREGNISPLTELDTRPPLPLGRCTSPQNRRSKSISPSRVEQVEAAARYAAEHAIRVAGNSSQQYSPPSSPPKLTSPLSFMDTNKKNSSLISTFPQISSSLTTDALNSTTTSKFMSNLPTLPKKDNIPNAGLNALLNNGFNDTSVSRCPPILPSSTLDSMPPGNPAALSGALAAIQAGQSSIQQVTLHFIMYDLSYFVLKLNFILGY